MRESNIGPRQRRSRFVGGVVMALLCAAGAVLMANTDWPRAWRLVLFVPLWVSGLGLFQALDKT